MPGQIRRGLSLAMPEVMGYTNIAGTPMITGLYTILISMALFGSMRHLVVIIGSKKHLEEDAGALIAVMGAINCRLAYFSYV